MKCEVKLYVAGTVFTEQVQAVDYAEARRVALARNPNAKVISVNAVFDQPSNTWSEQQNDSSSNYTNSSSGSSGGGTTSFNDLLGLCILGGGIWAFVTLTPWLFLAGGATFGGWIGTLMPKNYKGLTGTVLALALGITGFVQGDKLQKDWFSDSAVIETEQLYAKY